MSIYRAIGSRSGEASTLEGLSKVYQTLGDYKKANETQEQLSKIRRELGVNGGEKYDPDNDFCLTITYTRTVKIAAPSSLCFLLPVM